MNLFGLESISEDERKNIAKRSLSNLLTSYADEADIFAEIVQNAFDSVMKAHRDGLYVDDQRPKLTIIIGRRISGGHHYFYVADNGTGMSPDVAANLTVPGYSHGKKKGKTVGYKGVGASYFFAASQKVAMKTIDVNEVVTEVSVRGSFEWIKGEDERPPEVTPTAEVPDVVSRFLPQTRGTGLYFQFHDGMKPKNLNGLVVVGDGNERELKNWACFFASKTALGIVEPPAVQIEVELCLDLGDQFIKQLWRTGEFNRENNVVGYPFPSQVLRNGKSVDEIEATALEQRHRHNKRWPAIYKRWTSTELIAQLQLEPEESAKLVEHLNWVEGYLCYSTDVLKEVNARLGGRSQLIRYGMRIAVDGVPQGRNVDLSLTSSQGLDRQSHIVLSFKGLELDTGRKISADEVVASALSKVGQKVVNVLKEYRWAMKKKDRPDVTSDLNNWRNEVSARSPSSMIKSLYALKGIPALFRVDPANESEVIALYVSLLANGLLKGYKLQAISGYSRYDSLTDIDNQSDAVRDLDDPLSVRDPDPDLDGEAKVLEFKFSFDDLLQDFADKVKNPTEIDFVVCWTLPDLNLTRGRLEPCYGNWRDHRSVYGASYIWHDENDSALIPVICLRNVIAELLSNVEASQGIVAIGRGTFEQISRDDRDGLI